MSSDSVGRTTTGVPTSIESPQRLFQTDILNICLKMSSITALTTNGNGGLRLPRAWAWGLGRRKGRKGEREKGRKGAWETTHKRVSDPNDVQGSTIDECGLEIRFSLVGIPIFWAVVPVSAPSKDGWARCINSQQTSEFPTSLETARPVNAGRVGIPHSQILFVMRMCRLEACTTKDHG